MSYRFVCLTDVGESRWDTLGDGIEHKHLQQAWPGWWAKLELFRLPGPVLYFDLDTLILGDLTAISQQAVRGSFTMLRDFYRPDGFGSGMMAWSAQSQPIGLYERFLENPCRWMEVCHAGGDQQFVEIITRLKGIDCWQDVLPGQVISYKAHGCELRAPAAARVMCLHGRPKFPDMPPESWARQAWEKAA